ncbi:MAG: hypothetical protein ACFB8W_09190 [Elainellaceae cyanobacterium]
MKDITQRCWRRLGQQLLTICLSALLSLVSVMAIAVPPSLAQIPLNTQKVEGQTKGEVTGRLKNEPLSPEERLDRAYDISEGAGLLEEKRQAEGKFDPKEDNESLVEKAKDALDDLTGGNSAR